MIAITTNRQPVATSPKSYDKKSRAIAAAVRVLGPEARDGFEFTVSKVDGGWFWRATDEVRPDTDQQRKANGGKRGAAAAVESFRKSRQTDAPLPANMQKIVGNGSDPDQSAATRKAENAVAETTPRSRTVKRMAAEVVAMLSTREGGMPGNDTLTAPQATVIKEETVGNTTDVTIAVVVPDAVRKGLHRVKTPDGAVSPPVNLTRAKDAAAAANRKVAKDHETRPAPKPQAETRPDGLKAGTKNAAMLDMVLAGWVTEEEVCKELGWKACMVTLRRVCEKAGVDLQKRDNPAGGKAQYHAVKGV